MNDEKLIKYLGDYAMKIMGREIGYKKTSDWLNNYKFPTDHRELVKLANIWHGTIQNFLMDYKDQTNIINNE